MKTSYLLTYLCLHCGHVTCPYVEVTPVFDSFRHVCYQFRYRQHSKYPVYSGYPLVSMHHRMQYLMKCLFMEKKYLTNLSGATGLIKDTSITC